MKASTQSWRVAAAPMREGVMYERMPREGLCGETLYVLTWYMSLGFCQPILPEGA